MISSTGAKDCDKILHPFITKENFLANYKGTYFIGQRVY
jgi:hypothetical protein